LCAVGLLVWFVELLDGVVVLQIREMLAMYIKSHQLEKADDRSRLVIAPTDETFALIRSAVPVQGTASTTSATVHGNSLTEKASTGIVKGNVKDAEVLEEETVDEEDDDGTLLAKPLSQSVAGVMLCDDPHSPWGTAHSSLAMKVPKEGLKSVEYLTPGLAPAVPRTINKVRGGWGTDPGKEWKPILLPPAPPKKVVGYRPVAPSSSLLSSAYPVNGNPHASKETANKPPKVTTQTPTPVLNAIELSKEEFMKAVLAKMTGYHGILQPSGEVNIHSGKVPKVHIVVEQRMGRRVC
jgi:hypothetical protein